MRAIRPRRPAACVLVPVLALLLPVIAAAGETRVVAAGVLEQAGHLLPLAGVQAPPPGALCKAPGREWPCGRIAGLALAERVAVAKVRCEPSPGGAGVRCRAGGEDLSRWLLAAGWARAAAGAPSAWQAVEAAARAAGLGIWRGGGAGAEWRIEEEAGLGCDACAARKSRLAPPDGDT